MKKILLYYHYNKISMSKRTHEKIDENLMNITNESDEEFDQKFDIRKMQKCSKDEILGFCDGCNKLKPVTADKEFPEFTYCIDCQIDNLSFEADMLNITPPELKRTHKVEK